MTDSQRVKAATRVLMQVEKFDPISQEDKAISLALAILRDEPHPLISSDA